MTLPRQRSPEARPPSRRVRTSVLAAAALAAAAALSACSDAGYVDAALARPAGGSTAPATSAPTGGLGTGVTTVGTVVTSDGFTLYRFTKDPTRPSKSTCTGECAVAWPPVHGDGQPVLQGIPSGLVGTIGRPDGTQQLTLGGWPLYRYAGDRRPGDANGEGMGGVWQAIGPAGKPAATLPGSSPGAAAGTLPAPATTHDQTADSGHTPAAGY
ncbi:hypothetical protein GCM10009836_40160 [Pseudonocardia ailaonensis]|uniref:Lipoprotein with Yx(FWY)xxD motif n=1 Tax=Pseudonocardia ailaonensis TaxID=367279 RepID=A0ABN2NAD5_9PSEU